MKRIINVEKKKVEVLQELIHIDLECYKDILKKKTFIKYEWVVKILILNTYTNEAVEKKAPGFLYIQKLPRSLHHFATVPEWNKRDQ